MNIPAKQFIKIQPVGALAAVLLVVVIASCDSMPEGALFQQLSSKKTNITFENTLTESDTLNYFLYPYLYMGGGVSVGDFNNDGLTDIFLVGNMVPSRLYLNSGNFVFEDVTEISNTGGGNQWKLGSTICDINNDGLLDIYVCVSGLSSNRENLLFVNQGINKNGIPIFKEEAKKYGINDPGMSTQGTFFDYDNDGDLDLYVANYPITNFKATPYLYKQMMRNVKWIESGHLYRNNDNGTFTDVTKESGLLAYGLTLSATVGDFNQDGYKDLYISNDFTCPDYFYFNNGDGTFSDKAGEVLGQTSFYGMGVDVADYNNDGLLDIMQIDMAPEDNKRAKENMSSMLLKDFEDMLKEGLHHQYRYSTLQLNSGIMDSGLPFFSNAAWIAGVTSTDWSWAALFADFNLDGWKDLFITNGIRRDINNLDFFKKMAEIEQQKGNLNNQELLEMVHDMPYHPLVNYLYKNNGDLTFSKYSKEWGITEKNYSNGAAYADLDNDGDLELIVNNVDGVASIYKNNAREMNLGNFIKIDFKGQPHNAMGVGSVVTIWHNSKMQTAELTLSRGYISSVEPILYFGIARDSVIDSLRVVWPDGKVQKLRQLKVNQKITISYLNISDTTPKGDKNQLFNDKTSSSGVEFNHMENKFNDYAKQVLLPHKLSTGGPHIATGDVNGDGSTDFFVGNALNSPAAMYIQREDGTFQLQRGPWEDDADFEDMGTLLFDADGDGDLDLYVVSGGNEFPENSEKYRDRLYLNTGNGIFVKAMDALPPINISGSCLKALDFDNDGDLDLFIGGRHVPGKYPYPARSYLLRNNSSNGDIKFEDVTAEVAPGMLEAGMVTSAFCADIDGDQSTDIIVAGEWMPICIFRNINGKFVKSVIPGTKGWWFSIDGADMDNDGAIDLVAGNLGLNMRYKASPEQTFDVYANDFDKNGTIDIALCYYQGNKQYPVRSRECYLDQNPGLAKKFPSYKSFAEATIQDIYTKEILEKSLHLKAELFASCYLENQGNGEFKIMPLPNEAQLSSINGIILDDIDRDGKMDILTAGNFFEVEIVTPRGDAGVGLYLKGDGNGKFSPITPVNSGFFANGNIKALSLIHFQGSTTKKGVIVGANDGKIRIFHIK